MTDADAIWLVAGGEPGAARFGQLVQRLRKESQMSVEDLARDAGLSVGTIRAIEQARRAPSEESGLRLLRVLLPEDALSVHDVDAGAQKRGRPDITLTDPDSGAHVLLEFKAKTAGDNRRWSSDKPPPEASQTEELLLELMSTPEWQKNAREHLFPTLAAITASMGEMLAGAKSPASDDDFGRVVRRLATLRGARMGLLENLLWMWDLVDRDRASHDMRALVSRLDKSILAIRPMPPEEEIIDLSEQGTPEPAEE